ncbi:protein ROOT PRIMORDIUM DEFECTIVE 1-like [Dorcoceras hygrometricum]|uniref:Protein ROOT PRIMORDIUM DEFECTIVE 1-like n=1 Tax=Dorcoceras hygrometricum TaxID=472368 RepID=A0A2Z7CRA0_9LAMI|nr:protein ROOT PRIMORDIUM DEFECTIVE 1-like [Dorcoceras hygrometricum]
MHHLRRLLPGPLRRDSTIHHHRTSTRALYDFAASIRCPRDRGLDYAVARERHLKPVINLKDFIISEPSKSAPLSLLTQSKETLQIPFRPIEFIRKYPSIFQEFCPGSLNVNPHVKLSPEAISLSSEERLVYESVNYKQDIACRLLKLLMIAKVNKIPIFLLERLKWELGLPQDYEMSVIPEFPDYFRVIDGGRLGENWKMLELVCWSDEFSVSEMEKKGDKDGKIHFFLQYSKDFEMDKKYKKWVDEWQKLPYVSAYENAMHLASTTDESDKWAVAVLHEVLSLFVGKKADRESLLSLGEFLGLRSRFKRAFLQHPGIFYVSSKIGMHTVVLKEAYKRGTLIERHPLMDMRFKYVQLMNVVKDESKTEITQKQKTVVDTRKGEEESDDNGNGEEDDSEMYELLDDDDGGGGDDDDDDEEEEEEEGENNSKRGRFKERTKTFEDKNPERSLARRANGQRRKESNYNDEHRSSRRVSKSKIVHADQRIRGKALRNLDNGENATAREGFFRRQPTNFEGLNSRRKISARGVNGQSRNENGHDSSTRSSKQTSVRGDRVISRRGPRKWDKDVNATSRERFKQQPATFEGKDFERSTARSRNGRSTNDSNYESSTRFSRNIRGDQRLPQRTTPNLDVS